LPTVPFCGTGICGEAAMGNRFWGSGSAQLKYRASYGQAAMQARDPTQASASTSTSPSSVRIVAPTGQTYMQGASSHIMQGRGMWNVPPALSFMSKTLIQVCSSRSWWRCWQDCVHTWQPSQVRRSMTMHQACAGACAPFAVATAGAACGLVAACASSL